jgi:hypothetical protein
MLLTLSLLIIASIMLLFFKEPRTSVVPTKVNLLSSFKTLKSKPLRRWLLLINLCVIGDSMINTMLRPLLVDRGLSIDSIGFLLGTIRPFFWDNWCGSMSTDFKNIDTEIEPCRIRFDQHDRRWIVSSPCVKSNVD